jgi:hypothetical protein
MSACLAPHPQLLCQKDDGGVTLLTPEMCTAHLVLPADSVRIYIYKTHEKTTGIEHRSNQTQQNSTHT